MRTRMSGGVGGGRMPPYPDSTGQSLLIRLLNLRHSAYLAAIYVLIISGSNSRSPGIGVAVPGGG